MTAPESLRSRRVALRWSWAGERAAGAFSGARCPAALLLAAVVGCQAASDKSGTRPELLAQFQGLHRRVYDVYELGPDRDAVHDLLSQIFSGEELTREYLEHWTTLARMQTEGTAIDVLAVDYETINVAEAAGGRVVIEADWSVGGIVSHQQHKHHRVNRYRADYTLAPSGEDPGTLRIVDTRLRSAERIRTPMTGSGVFPLENLPTSERGFVGPAELLGSGLLDEESASATGEQLSQESEQ